VSDRERDRIGLGLGEEVDLARFQQQFAPGEERAVEMAPLKEPATPREWIGQNLFSSWFNSVLTVVTGAVGAFVVYQILRFVFVSGEWAVIRAGMRSYMVGGFPSEEWWRVWSIVYGVALLAGLTWGIARVELRWTIRKAIVAVVVAGFAAMILQYTVRTSYSRVLVAGVIATVAAAAWLGRIVGPRLRRPLLIAWLLAFPAIIFVLRGFDGVPPKLWEGFLFNLIAATVGIFASFPIGIALALGRRAQGLPAIKTVCVAFIELFRGVPLVAWLIFSKFGLDLLLPPQWDVPDIIKAFIVMTLFSSAYVAEIVRGGLQGVHFGQFDAARALGLPTTRMMILVILPQALRSTIPAMISHFISLFKDTALFSAIEIFELLEAARRSSSNLLFLGTDLETLLFAGLVFWIVAFSMSRWSQRLEVRLGVGER